MFLFLSRHMTAWRAQSVEFLNLERFKFPLSVMAPKNDQEPPVDSHVEDKNSEDSPEGVEMVEQPADQDMAEQTDEDSLADEDFDETKGTYAHSLQLKMN